MTAANRGHVPSWPRNEDHTAATPVPPPPISTHPTHPVTSLSPLASRYSSNGHRAFLGDPSSRVEAEEGIGMSLPATGGEIRPSN